MFAGLEFSMGNCTRNEIVCRNTTKPFVADMNARAASDSAECWVEVVGWTLDRNGKVALYELLRGLWLLRTISE